MEEQFSKEAKEGWRFAADALERSTVAGGAQYAEKTMIGERPTRSTPAGGVRSVEKNLIGERVVVQTGAGASQAKVFKAHAVPQGLCEKLDQCAQTGGQTSRKMEIAQSRVLLQAFVKEAGKELWRA